MRSSPGRVKLNWSGDLGKIHCSARMSQQPMRKFALLALTSVLAVVCLAQGDRVPAYHDHALQPGDAMPILPKDQWWGESFKYPYQVQSYELAAKMPSVLYQLPCYCYCDRMGHGSLHSCFEKIGRAHV